MEPEPPVEDVLLGAGGAVLGGIPPPPSTPPPPLPSTPPPPRPADDAPPPLEEVLLEPAEDVVLSRRAPPAAPSGLSLVALVDVIGTATSIDDLKELLGNSCVRDSAGRHAAAVRRCLQYCEGLAKPEERVLAGWPVLSINEWGTQQLRTLVLSSHALCASGRTLSAL